MAVGPRSITCSHAQGQPCSGAAVLRGSIPGAFSSDSDVVHADTLHPHCLSHICTCGHTSPTLFVIHMHVRSHFTHTVCHTYARAVTLHPHCLSHMCTCDHTSLALFVTHVHVRSHFTHNVCHTYTVARIHMRQHIHAHGHTYTHAGT